MEKDASHPCATREITEVLGIFKVINLIHMQFALSYSEKNFSCKNTEVTWSLSGISLRVFNLSLNEILPIRDLL